MPGTIIDANAIYDALSKKDSTPYLNGSKYTIVIKGKDEEIDPVADDSIMIPMSNDNTSFNAYGMMKSAHDYTKAKKIYDVYDTKEQIALLVPGGNVCVAQPLPSNTKFTFPGLPTMTKGKTLLPMDANLDYAMVTINLLTLDTPLPGVTVVKGKN